MYKQKKLKFLASDIKSFYNRNSCCFFCSASHQPSTLEKCFSIKNQQEKGSNVVKKLLTTNVDVFRRCFRFLVCHPNPALYPLILRSQPQHDVKATLYGRCYDVKKFKRRRINVALTSCSDWISIVVNISITFYHYGIKAWCGRHYTVIIILRICLHICVTSFFVVYQKGMSREG